MVLLIWQYSLRSVSSFQSFEIKHLAVLFLVFLLDNASDHVPLYYPGQRATDNKIVGMTGHEPTDERRELLCVTWLV